MFKKDTRRGLALGAAFSLIASLFVAAPAAQADEAGVVVTPFVGTSNTMLITEEFVVKTRLGLNVTATRIENLKYLVEKPAGYNLSVSNTVSSVLTGGNYSAASTTLSNIAAAETFSYVTPVGAVNTGINQLRLSPWSESALTSISKAVTVKVTAFLDIDPDGKFNSASEPYQTYEVKFVPWADLAGAVTLAQPVFGATTVSATAAVSGVNFEQLNSGFYIQVKTNYVTDNATSSGDLSSFIAAGTMSASFPVSSSAPVDSSVSATLFYSSNSTLDAGEELKVSKLGVAVATITAVTASAVASANLVATDNDDFAARLNSEFAVKVWALTNSTVVAAKVPTATVTTSNAALSETKYIVVNGVTYTQSSTLNGATFALVAGTDGKGTMTIRTVGFADTDWIDVKFASENQKDDVRVTAEAPKYGVERTAGSYLVTTVGTAVTAEFAIEDQFGEASSLTDQQVVFTIAGTGFSTSTVAVPVVGSKASVTANPSATATGSYTVTPNLQYKDRVSGNWVDEANISGGEVAVTVYVQSTIVNSFSTKPTATASASISYGVALSWSGEITAAVAVTGSEVVVSATGVTFQYDSKTYSDTVKMTAGVGGAVSFKATSRKAGKYTISFVAGTATGSTILTVDAAGASAAKDITFDKSTLVQGATTTITGTVADENGNPIKTSGSDVVVSWTGKGLPFGTGTLATDADGKFSINVLVLGTETGTGTLTATYRPSSSATDTKNITVAKTFSIDAPAVVPAPEVNAVIGTFNGRWAVRVENAKGSVVSVKVGGNWFKYTSLNENYLFSRKSVVGRSVAVAVYVNGTLENVATITIK
jgi:hypothetical protein